MQLQEVFCAFLLFLSSQHTWMWSVEIQQLFWTLKTEAIKLGWWGENRTSQGPSWLLTYKIKRFLPWLTHHFMIATVSPSSHSLQWYIISDLTQRKSDVIISFLLFLPLCFYRSVILSGFPYSFFLHFQTSNVLVSPAHKHHPFSSKDNKSHYYFILCPSVHSLIHFYCFTSK